MAVQPFHAPKFRAFDANGNPLAGGLLYSYAAGTTTPQATYTTRAGNVANSNPVVLDANGEAEVWVTPNISYKFVLKNSAGVTQWTTDSVPSLPDLSLVPLQLGDGTVSAPALSFINDPDCGLYRIGSETVGMAVTGVEVQRWSSDGIAVTGDAEVTGTIPMTGTNPASTTAFENTLTKKSLIKAWGTVMFDGAGGADIVDGFNVTSATNVAGTYVRIAFANGMSNTNYAVLVTPIFASGTSNNFCQATGKTTAQFDVSIYNVAGSVNPEAVTSGISFLVLGAQ